MKKEAFEYFIYKINMRFNNDFSQQKLMALLFFLCNCEEPKTPVKYPLYRMFDNWIIVPWGLVEKDIYEVCKNDNLERYTLTRFSTNIKKIDREFNIPGLYKFLIDAAVEKLSHIDFLEGKDYTYLSNLIREHESWIVSYRKAGKTGDKKVSQILLETETKFFSL